MLRLSRFMSMDNDARLSDGDALTKWAASDTPRERFLACVREGAQLPGEAVAPALLWVKPCWLQTRLFGVGGVNITQLSPDCRGGVVLLLLLLVTNAGDVDVGPKQLA